MQEGLEVPYRVHELPSRICESWAGIGPTRLEPSTFMLPCQILRLREAIYVQPLISEDRLVAYSERMKIEVAAVTSFTSVANTAKSKPNSHGRRRKGVDDENKTKALAVSTAAGGKRRPVCESSKNLLRIEQTGGKLLHGESRVN